jgi:phosphoserine aminotransferase
MGQRVLNFNPGPSTLPLPVLETVREELLDYRGSGMSVMEISHRSGEFEEIIESGAGLARELFGLPAEYHVLFLTGGASQQFAMIPLNFLAPQRSAVYVDTGSWSSKAIRESERVGKTRIAFSGKSEDYRRIPADAELQIAEDAAYLHLTTNNTIQGTQFQRTPDVAVPLIADMSSDIGSRRREFSRYAMFYAGAQKNLGPAGVTLVVLRDDLLQRANDALPSLLHYKTQASKRSLYNTPPCFPIYVVKLVLEWIRDQGGLAAMEQASQRKQELVYGIIDRHPEFFRGTVEPQSRSWMNVTLRLPDEELERRFLSEAAESGLVGLKGHRSVGGIRASLYNAMPVQGVEQLVHFMEQFLARA